MARISGYLHNLQELIYRWKVRSRLSVMIIIHNLMAGINANVLFIASLSLYKYSLYDAHIMGWKPKNYLANK